VSSSLSMASLPAFQFYPGDWIRDPVAGCSLAAQGLWLRMMLLAHDSTRYGYLCNADGSPMNAETCARRCACTPQEYEALITELTIAGVPSRTNDGIIFSRRMVRDHAARLKAAERKRKERQESNGVTPPSHPMSHPPSRAPSRARHGPSSSSPSVEDSESEALSGAAAPTRPKSAPYHPDVIWNFGREMLEASGLNEPSARALLGKLSKHHGKENLAKAIAATMSANPADPRAYLLKVLQNEQSAGAIAKAKRDVGKGRTPPPATESVEEEQVHWTTDEIIDFVNKHEKEQEQADMRAPEPN